MNKSNIFKTSNFYMDENDVLHMIIIDETGTPLTVELIGGAGLSSPEDGSPSIPVAIDATSITESAMTANWQVASFADGYYLDVAIDSLFTSFVSGYQNLDVGNVLTYPVLGLSSETDYYYRVRAYNDIGTSDDSNTIGLTTIASGGTYVLLAGTSPGGLILSSTDNGVTFTSLGTLGVGNPLCFYQSSNGAIFYGTDEGYVVNHTEGTYDNVSAYQITALTGYLWDVDGNEYIVAGDDNGGYYVWVKDGTPALTRSFGYAIRDIIVSDIGTSIFTSNGIYNASGVLIQAGNFFYGAAYDTEAGDPSDPSVANLYYAIDQETNIYKSTDYGLTWNFINKPLYEDVARAIFAIGNSQIGLFSAGDSLFVTDDGFETTTEYTFQNDDNTVCAAYLGSNVMVIGDDAGGIWRSTDNGVTWGAIVDNPQQGQSSINCMINYLQDYNPSNIYYLYDETYLEDDSNLV